MAARRVPRAPIPVAFALAVLAVLATAAPEQAAAQTVTTFLSNTGLAKSNTLRHLRAQAFTTGTGTYTLSSVAISVGSSAGTPVVQIYGDTSGNPGTLVATMTNPAAVMIGRVNVFTAPANTTLTASTTYWVVTSNSAASTGAGFRVNVRTNADLDSGTAAGWSMGNTRWRSSNANSWAPSSSRLQFQIRGTEEATPNAAPTVANAIPDQTATAGTGFSYQFPANTFNDTDTGDTLSYTATKADDTMLPTWLTFTDSTRTFAGTPATADTGTVSVKVTASDSNGGSVSNEFDIVVSADPLAHCDTTDTNEIFCGTMVVGIDGSDHGFTASSYGSLSPDDFRYNTDYHDVVYLFYSGTGFFFVTDEYDDIFATGFKLVLDTDEFSLDGTWDEGKGEYTFEDHGLSWSANDAVQVKLLSVPPANSAPTVANAIPDQTATAGTAFSYAFPDTTFNDTDTGDTLSYAATKADDTMLPTWLAFTDSTRTFAGTPATADTGTVSVKVTASDSNGGSVSNEFDITVAATVPGAPTGLTATASGTSTINLSWTAPASDGGSAITSYKIEDSSDGGSTWFDLVVGISSTTTTYVHTGLAAGTTRHYRVSAINIIGTGLSSDVANATTDAAPTNAAPTVANVIPDQTATAGTAFSYAFPDTTFNDTDTGDTLSYAATKADDTMLPTWLAFTDSTRTFAGTPATADTGTVSVKVTASDGNGGSVSDDFNIVVSADPNAGICARTAAVRDAILAKITGVTDCALVTDTHLAAITGSLLLNQKSITALAAGDFDGLTALTVIDLTDNPVTALPAGVFDELTALLALGLSDNSLTGLPADVFDKLTALQQLFLNGNSLTGLPAGVFDELTALTELYLHGNSLTALPADVFDELTALLLLYLHGNSLTALPADAFDELAALQQLHLHGNSLTALPAGVFDGLTALTLLDLDTNSLTALPDDVFEPLTSLTSLDLSGNPGAPFSPTAVALPDDGTVPAAGGTVMLDGSGSGGAWGTNVTYSWALTTPTSGVTVTFDDAAIAEPTVTIPQVTAGTDLVFTLTVTGRADNSSTSISPGTDTATVTPTTPTTPTNAAPTVANVIPDQTATAGTAFSYAFPDTTFNDTDTGDTLSYAATKADDTMLPTWLAFTAGTRTFAGTPATADTGTVSVKVTASDGNGGSVSDDFNIVVAADTTPPTLTRAVVHTSGLLIQLEFSENLQSANLPAASAVTVTADGSAVTVTGVTQGGGLDRFSVSVSPARIRQGQAVVVTYTDPTAGDDANAIQDASGNDAASFTTGMNSVPAVTNSSTRAAVAPGVPTGLTATASGTTRINLSWTAPADNGGSAITGYRIEVSPNGTSNWTGLVANTASTTTTYEHTGLAAGTTRHYRVSAINSVGTSTSSDVVNATTNTANTAPGAPTGLTATASGTTRIDLSWTAPASTGGSAITGYRIEVSPNGTSSWTGLVANTASTTTTYEHTGLAAGTTRHYRVSAINSVGTSTSSDVANATTGTVIDTRPPVLSGATVNGGTLVLAYDETLDGASVPAAGAFAVTAAGSAVAVNGVSVGGSAVTLTLASAVQVNQTVTLDYTPGTNPIQDGAGNDAAALSGRSVTNNTPGVGPMPRVSIGPWLLSVSEDVGDAVLTVSLDRPAASALSVAWHTQEETAEAPDDFTASEDPVTFAPGETRKTISVPIVDDAVREDPVNDVHELFFVMLSRGEGYTLADNPLADSSAAIVEIVDNDGPPSMDSADDALALVDGVTPEVAAAVLLGEQTLGEAQLAALDRLGNRNGRYDLGDLLSWIARCRRGEARCGRTSTDSGPASAAMLAAAAAGSRSIPRRPRRRDSGRRGRSSIGGIRRRARKAGQVLAILLAATTAWSCTEGGSVAPAAYVPDPGFLTVEWSGPATNRDVGVLLELEGPTIDAVRAPGLELYESSAPGPHRIVVAGVLRPGPLVQFRVPDRNQFALYSVRVLEVTGEDYGLRDAGEYQAVIKLHR